MAASSEAESGDRPAKQTSWEEFKEWLLPSNSFERSASPRKDLAFGRISLAVLYLALTAVFVYTLVRLLYSGRIELFSSLYKVDFVEAPSLAFCPFTANDTIASPHGGVPGVTANKVELNGNHILGVQLSNCSFDRHCKCVDMDKFTLQDVNPENSPGPAGSSAMVFRESIEIRTNLSDPSPEHVLKVGIYDSHDRAPDWFYVNQGAMFIGQLELIVWTVVDVSIHGLVKTLKGDIRAMVKNRHIFRYTSQQVGQSRLLDPPQKEKVDRVQEAPETSIRYEMKTFFVEETMSSHRALSWYTVGVVVALIALRWVVVDAFFAVFMPEWQEQKDETPVRELSPVSVWLRDIICCCMRDDGDKAEKDPLLKKSLA